MTNIFKSTALVGTAALAIAIAVPANAQQANANAQAQASAEASANFDYQAIVEYAGERAAAVIAQLEAEGYKVVEMSRTLLGRIEVTIENEVHVRRVFISRATGEIKQDMIVEVRAGKTQTAEAPEESTEDTSENATQEDANTEASASVTATGSASGSTSGVSLGGSLKGSVSLSGN